MHTTKAEWAGIGYGLDLGGYEFTETEPDTELGNCLVFSYSSLREFGEFPGWRPDCIDGSATAYVAYFAVGVHDMDWPDIIEDSDAGDTWRLITVDHLNETDRECICHGVDDGADGWELTGNVMDDPNPDCPRCDGNGYVTSPGGVVAYYGTFPNIDRAERELDRSLTRLRMMNRQRRDMYVVPQFIDARRAEAASWCRHWRDRLRKERAAACVR